MALENQTISGVAPSPPKSIEPINTTSVVIEPRHGWASLGLNELWEYRDLIYFMVWRDLKGRYRQTALGPLWIILQPLMSMVLYTVVFGIIAKLPSDGIPYPVFSYVGLLPWSFFSDAYGNGNTSLSSGKDLIAKVYFPRLIIPISRLISSLVDLGISFVILVGMLIYYGIRPNWGIVLIPYFLLLAAATGVGVGLMFSGVIVRYRDFANLAGYILRAWMYLTPVVYSISIVPKQWLPLYWLNPMTQVVQGFRWALLNTGEIPAWTFVAGPLIALPLLIIGLFTFKRVERNIVDIA